MALLCRLSRPPPPTPPHKREGRKHAAAQSVLATRKPMLLLRLSGWFLLRLAERRFCGSLFQEPPRRTRKDGAVQAPGRKKVRSPAAEEIRSSGAADALSPGGGASCFGDDARENSTRLRQE